VARRADQVKIDSPTARKRLEPWHGVYWNVITRGCYLGYRRSAALQAGMWYAKYSPTKDGASGRAGARRLQTALGAADDVLPADDLAIYTYEQARKRAIEWFPVAAHKSTGIAPRRGKYTVADAARDYLRSLEGRSRSLYETTTIVESNIIPHLGDVLVEKLTRARIETWLYELAARPRRKPRHGLDANCEEAIRRRKDTANRYLTVLKAALNRCLADGRVACTGLAWKQVKPFKGVSQARTRFLKDDEARKLVLNCEADFKLLVQAALFSGARYSELARLKVGDFDSLSNTVFIAQSKSGKSRRVYLDPEASSFFEDVCSDRSAMDFMFQRGNGAWLKSGAKGLMAEVTKKAEIAPLTFHELRHTAASRWARQGLSLAEIAAQLGHADVRMTQRYAHLCQHTLADKIRALPAMGIYPVEKVQPTAVQ
jgi:integrase